MENSNATHAKNFSKHVVLQWNTREVSWSSRSESFFNALIKIFFLDICHRNWTAENFKTETERDFYECFHCDAKFKPNEKKKLIGHMQKQHMNSRKCYICSKKFKKASLFNEHIEGVHERKIKCKKCEKYFSCNHWSKLK